MKRTVYKVIINESEFIKTISRDLAERTAASAKKHYNLKAEIVEAFEEYDSTLKERL